MAIKNMLSPPTYISRFNFWKQQWNCHQFYFISFHRYGYSNHLSNLKSNVRFQILQDGKTCCQVIYVLICSQQQWPPPHQFLKTSKFISGFTWISKLICFRACKNLLPFLLVLRCFFSSKTFFFFPSLRLLLLLDMYLLKAFKRTRNLHRWNKYQQTDFKSLMYFIHIYSRVPNIFFFNMENNH